MWSRGGSCVIGAMDQWHSRELQQLQEFDMFDPTAQLYANIINDINAG